MDLRSLLSSIPKKHDFVSLESLTECMTEERIKDHISCNGIPVAPEELEVIFTRPRLFAILVLLGCERDVSALLDDVDDDLFFFFNEEQVPWKSSDNDQRAEFLQLQSQFPPILTCKHPPREFPDFFRPPFIHELNKGPSGSFGIVHQVKVAGGHLPEHSSNELLAWKRIYNRGLQERFQEEIKTLISRRHEHLVPLVACYSTPGGQSYQSQDPALHLFFPWADANMFDWMRLPHPPEHLRGPEEPRRRKEYLYQTIMSLLSGVSYLHREIGGVFTSHHDLKPHNILLLGEQWKICDFGMTRLRSLDEGSKTERILGSKVYHPPEYEDKAFKKHGRSFDVWSMGCIIVELAVLFVYGWEGGKLCAFKAERARNRSGRTASSTQDDVSFHNNILVVRKWMWTLAREDGSRNFKYLVDTASGMLFMDRDGRPYSWEVEIYLYEQLHPNEIGNERRAKIGDLVQPPMKSYKHYQHNPLVKAVAENNEDFCQCLREKGWTLGPSKSSSMSTISPKNTSEHFVSMLRHFTLSSSQIAELFTQTYRAHGYGSNNMENEEEQHHRETLAQTFADRIASANITFCEIMQVLEPRHPLDLMKIFTEEVDVNQTDHGGNTALFWASWGRDVITVDILLRYGAELDPINKLSETPLMVASMLGHAAVVERLLDQYDPSVEINYRNKEKRTSLSYAAQFGRTKVAELLLKYGADPQIAGIHGRTPLSLAAGSCNKEIVEQLLALPIDAAKADNDNISPLAHAIAEEKHRKRKGEAKVNLLGYQGIIEMLRSVEN